MRMTSPTAAFKLDCPRTKFPVIEVEIALSSATLKFSVLPNLLNAFAGGSVPHPDQSFASQSPIGGLYAIPGSATHVPIDVSVRPRSVRAPIGSVVENGLARPFDCK